MTNTEITDIECDVDLPREDDRMCIPTSWTDDEKITFAAKGFLIFLASFSLGRIIRPVDQQQPHPDDPPLSAMVEALKTADYLIRDTTVSNVRYRLVHPARLGPLPAFNPDVAR